MNFEFEFLISFSFSNIGMCFYNFLFLNLFSINLFLSF